MTPQELKNSILQLAIQGRLVEQRPEEGTAQELYQQIQAEKKRLIKEGKIKKEKPLPEITEDEKPFEIPESWMWVRLNSIALINPKNELDGKLETSFIPMALLADGYRSSYTYEIRCWKDIKKGFTHFAAGDIGIAKITPCFQNRKSAIFTELKNGYGAGTTELSIVRVIGNTMSREFLLWFFKSAYFIENGIKSFTGTAGQQRINKDYLPHCALPFPPLAEQKRIVAKIEELLPLVDRYEAAWTRLEDFNRRFPEDMKKSILQQAIQGKLVEQRPEEGTAQELYEQIQAEKRRLIKEGKIKKKEDFEYYQQGNLDWLIERGSVQIDADGYLRINRTRTAVLGDLFYNEVVCPNHYDKNLHDQGDTLFAAGDMYYESTLFSKPEQDYLNYVLNRSKFTNGLDLRNKYIHDTCPLDEETQAGDYIELLKIMVLTIIKINEEFCLGNP